MEAVLKISMKTMYMNQNVGVHAHKSDLRYEESQSECEALNALGQPRLDLRLLKDPEPVVHRLNAAGPPHISPAAPVQAILQLVSPSTVELIELPQKH